MTNGITLGLSALAGVWLGWWAFPICISVVALALLLEEDARWSLLAMCVIVSGFGALRSEEPADDPTSELLAASSGAIGRVESFPRPSGDGHRVLFTVSDLCIGEQCIPADETVILYLTEQIPPVSRGQILQVRWRLQPLSQLPPGYTSFVRSHGATASARTDDVRVIDSGPSIFQHMAKVNHSIATGLARLLPGDAGALATGIVIGDDSALSNSAVRDFQFTGTAHITAVSGQNVTIILGFLSLWWQPRTILGRRIFHIVLAMVIWSYASLVGLEPPALRAAIVATLTILGKHVGRRPDPVTLLALTLGGMALLNPLIVHGLGFWLSATASGALCLALPQHLSDRPRKRVLEIALGPVVASLATMPLVLGAFGTWSPVSMLANILISPVIALAFWVTYPFALLALILPGFAAMLAWIPGIVLDVALVIVSWLTPIASQVRVETVSPWGMLLLWLAIGAAVWLISGESERWIRSGSRATGTRLGGD